MNGRRKHVSKMLALLQIGLLAAACGTPACAETLKVAVAQRGFWNSTFVDIAEKQGYFKEAGLTIEVLYTEGGASTLTPLIAGSVDVAMSNGILGVIAAYAKNMPVRVITAEATGAAEAFWYARPESGIRSLKDTDGRTVAFSSPGSSTNLVLLQLLKAAGAHPKIVPTGGAPATFTQVMTGQIDVGWSVPPFALKDLQDKKIVIIARGSDVAEVQAQTIRVNVANAGALAQKRDAFKRYVKALGRAIDWAYSSPDALENYADIAHVPVALAKVTRDEFFPKESLQLGEIRGLETTLQQALAFKYITAPLAPKDVASLFDMLAAEKP
jgi:NitT/TauT family transport system substrate-binding protein